MRGNFKKVVSPFIWMLKSTIIKNSRGVVAATERKGLNEIMRLLGDLSLVRVDVVGVSHEYGGPSAENKGP